MFLFVCLFFSMLFNVYVHTCAPHRLFASLEAASAFIVWSSFSLMISLNFNQSKFSRNLDLFALSLGCTKMHESQNVMGADSQNRLLYQTKSLQNELGFFLQNCGGAQFLKFWAFLEGKTAPKRL